MNEPSDPLVDAVTETIANHPRQVDDWFANRPGAWGFLAGQGILAYRTRLGRRLDQSERRRIWAALWAALEHKKALTLGPDRRE